MRYLSLQEKIDNFTSLLKESANKLGCVFYEDSGEGHDKELETIYLEDVSGWLVPIGTALEDAKTEDNYVFAEWSIQENGNIIIEFKKY